MDVETERKPDVDWPNATFHRLRLTTGQSVQGRFTIQRLHSHQDKLGAEIFFPSHPVFVGEDGKLIPYHAVLEFHLWEPVPHE